MSGKPAVGLSTWLALLVIGAVVPLLFFAGATLLGISKTAQASRDRAQVDTARALALVVDGGVRSWKAALTALAAGADEFVSKLDLGTYLLPANRRVAPAETLGQEC